MAVSREVLGARPSALPAPAGDLGGDACGGARSARNLRLCSRGPPQADGAAGTIDSHGCWAVNGLAGFHEAGDLPVLEGDGARPVSSGDDP